ncbi:MAG: NTP transferase domain-containing protein [Frankia sp.]|nr:NTP transferase domain-containing protein [Frankia sp.]
MRVAGLLLAAGAGSRLGRPKALVRLGGTPLAERGARLLGAGGCAPVLVALGAAGDEARALLPAAVPGPAAGLAAAAGAADAAGAAGDACAPPPVPVLVVPVDGWAEGMGASLRAGLAAAAADPAVDAVVVALVDQPFVQPALVARLIAVAGWDDAAAGVAAVVAGYGGQPRTPVLLRRAVWAEVAELARGDVGARAWLRANPVRVLVVPCDDVGRPDDVDTAADLARLTDAD